LSTTPRPSALAPFQVRSFRFQWPADLATSWAFEMETIILGWYVLVETRSVFMLTVFASLLYLGTLLSPMFGVAGDRIGQRNLLCIMRSIYALCALTLMSCTFLGVLTPWLVIAITTVVGLVRPSDIGMRSALVGETMPPERLVGAMSIQRTTQDSARIAGALTGAGLVAALGMGPAYAVVSGFYLTSIALMLLAGNTRRAAPQTATRPSPWRDLREGFTYSWNTPHLRAALLLAFLLNLTAFPLFVSLLPVVAKEIYLADQTTLGYMVAGASSGALAGALILSRFGHAVRPARMMIVFSLAWFAMLVVFAHMPHPRAGIPVLFLAGVTQSLGLVPATAMLLRTSDQFRGRIMGLRMLAIYGNLPGLLLAGPLIAGFGYPVTATLYCAIGAIFTVVIAVRWRDHLWRRDAPANLR
jgi:MFS family permease